jgi:E3 ubiquitin-protein ligase HECTD1
VLELLCRRESKSVFEADGLECLLTFVKANASSMHKDTLHSSLSVASMLCGRLQSDNPSLPSCITSLTAFLDYKDTVIIDHALESLGLITDILKRANSDLGQLNISGLIPGLLRLLSRALSEELENKEWEGHVRVARLLVRLCRGSEVLANEVVRQGALEAVELILVRCEASDGVAGALRVVETLIVLVWQGHEALASLPGLEDAGDSSSRGHGQDLGAIEAIRNGNIANLEAALDSGADVNFADHYGQTVLVWAAYTGTNEMAEILLARGADPNAGRNPPLHYAARFGRPGMCKVGKRIDAIFVILFLAATC